VGTAALGSTGFPRHGPFHFPYFPSPSRDIRHSPPASQPRTVGAAGKTHSCAQGMAQQPPGSSQIVCVLYKTLSATPGYGNVYAALVDPADTTKVLAGENKGRTLRHAGVVRKLVLVGGSWRTKALGKKPFMLQASLPGTPGILDGMRLVVFCALCERLRSSRQAPFAVSDQTSAVSAAVKNPDW
jgi:hypothetical protein